MVPGDTVTLSVPNATSGAGDLKYEWYKITYDNNSAGWNQELIDGAEENTYTAEIVDGHERYSCKVADAVETETAYFFFNVDNQLTANRAVPDPQSVPYGESAVLAVEASCVYGDLTYAWYDRTGGSSTEIEGADRAEYTVENVTQYSQYYCLVKDTYGHQETVYFSVKVDNDLRIRTVSESNPKVLPHGEVTLEAEATCRSGNITYSWYDNDGEILGETSSTLVLKDITQIQRIWCYANDEYGNSVSTTFGIMIGSYLTIDSYTGNGETIYLPKGRDLDLVVSAASNSDQPITYSWFEDEDISLSDESTPSLHMSAVESSKDLMCIVEDGYNTRELHFNVSILDDGMVVSKKNVNVFKGETAVLSVTAVSTRSDTLTYQWYTGPDPDGYDFTPVSGATTDTLTVPDVTEELFYQCRVSDGEETKTVEVYVWIDSDFDAFAVHSGVKGAADGSALLEVEIEEKRKNLELRYSWYRLSETDELSLVSGENASRLSLKGVAASQRYRCIVTDQYDYTKEVTFTVYPYAQFASTPEEAVAQGRELTLDTIVTTECVNTPSNYYRFIPDEDGAYNITVSAPADKDFGMNLYDRSGSQLSGSITGEGVDEEFSQSLALT